MADVGYEALLGTEPVDEPGHDGRRLVRHPTTLATDQVDVLGLRRGMVGRRTVAEVGMLDEADLLEQLQRAVHRRDVHAGRPLHDPGMHILRRRVAEVGDGFEDQLTLGGQPETTRAQLGLQLVHSPSLGSPGASPVVARLRDVEVFYVGLLVAAGLAIAALAGYGVVQLFRTRS